MPEITHEKTSHKNIEEQDKQPNKKEVVKSLDSKESWLPTIFLTAAVLSIAGGFYLTYNKFKNIEELLLSRPAIAVIDTMAVASEIRPGQETAALQSIDRQAKTLASAGYVVLKESAILSAPYNYAVPTDVFLNDIQSTQNNFPQGFNQSPSSNFNPLTSSIQPVQEPQRSLQDGLNETLANLSSNAEPSNSASQSAQAQNNNPLANIIPTDGRTVEEQYEFQQDLKRQVEEAYQLLEQLNQQHGF